MPDSVARNTVRLASAPAFSPPEVPAVRPAPSQPAEVPLGPTSLPRSHNPRGNEDRGVSVNAVLLGLAAIPAAAIALIAPTSGEAQAATRAVQLPSAGSASAEALARAELFADRAQDEDPNVVELRQKVERLVNRSFGGDVRAAFDHYAGTDGQVSKSELSRLLSDAGVGNLFTRGAWVDGIMSRVDTSKNAKISWTEFQTVIRNAGTTGNA